MNLTLFENATRLSFFVVYFWFGILKVLDLSQATPLVNDLAAMTVPFIPQDTFFFILGLAEMLIGLLFFIKPLTKLTIFITTGHLLTTMLPLILLPQHTWMEFGVLSMEGQYILKNVFLFSALIGLYEIEKNRSRNFSAQH